MGQSIEQKQEDTPPSATLGLTTSIVGDYHGCNLSPFTGIDLDFPAQAHNS